MTYSHHTEEFRVLDGHLDGPHRNESHRGYPNFRALVSSLHPSRVWRKRGKALTAEVHTRPAQTRPGRHPGCRPSHVDVWGADQTGETSRVKSRPGGRDVQDAEQSRVLYCFF
ncbi:unnamed protein product [Boreogadus saida]